MPTPDGRIGSRDICTGAAVERVIADGGVTSLKISATLQSDNYSAGSAGWQINRATGSAEFQDVVVRGSLNASDIDAGVMEADYLGAGTIGAEAIYLTNSASSFIASANGSDWYIRGNGEAYFQDVTIAGTLETSSVDGDLTLSGGSFRTAGSGSNRLELISAGLYGYNSSNQNTGQLYMWSGAVSMLYPGGGSLSLTSSVAALYVGTEAMGIDDNNNVAWITVGSGTKVEVHSSYVYVADPIEGDDGSEGSPGYAFFAADDTGMWRNSSDYLYWSLGGSWKLGLTSSRLETRTGIGIFSGDNGSVGSPGLTFSNDTDSGVYVSGGFCGVAYGGSAVVVGNGSTQLYLGGMTSNAGSGTVRYIGTQIYYYASSKRFKHDIQPASLDPDSLLDWEPVWYRFNDNPEDRQLGWMSCLKRLEEA